MRKFLSLFFTAVFALGISVPALASDYNYYDYYENYNNYNYNNGYTDMTPVDAGSTNNMLGYVGNVTKANGYYQAEILDGDGYVSTVVLIPAINAIILDSTTGYPANLEDHNGNMVYIIYNQLTKVTSVVAINAELMNVPHLHTIEAIETYGNNLLLTVDNGGLIVTINEYTSLHAWLTRQILVPEDFQTGDRVLIWYALVGLSYPAKTTASRMVRLPAQDWELANYYPETYNDAPITHQLEGRIERAGVYLYPVRVNAAALGYTVNWNGQYRQAELTLGDKIISLAPDSAVFYLNHGQYAMTAPSLMQNGRLYAPASFFDNL